MRGRVFEVLRLLDIFAEKQTRGKLRDYPSMQCPCAFDVGARVHGSGVGSDWETLRALWDSYRQWIAQYGFDVR